MEITLEAVEKVMEETGVEYKTAKEALLEENGDVDAAIKSIQPDSAKEDKKIDSLIKKLKEKVAEGNVSKIRIRRGGDVILSVPVNVGIVGGIVAGIATAPWALIAATVAAAGLCKIDIIQKDGTIHEIN